jgi:enoyl-CoA hydratase
VRAVVLAASGRGFCGGVDIKEMQATEGHSALIGANRGCAADNATFGLPAGPAGLR